MSGFRDRLKSLFKGGSKKRKSSSQSSKERVQLSHDQTVSKKTLLGESSLPIASLTSSSKSEDHHKNVEIPSLGDIKITKEDSPPTPSSPETSESLSFASATQINEIKTKTAENEVVSEETKTYTALEVKVELDHHPDLVKKDVDDGDDEPSEYLSGEQDGNSEEANTLETNSEVLKINTSQVTCQDSISNRSDSIDGDQKNVCDNDYIANQHQNLDSYSEPNCTHPNEGCVENELGSIEHFHNEKITNDISDVPSFHYDRPRNAIGDYPFVPNEKEQARLYDDDMLSELSDMQAIPYETLYHDDSALLSAAEALGKQDDASSISDGGVLKNIDGFKSLEIINQCDQEELSLASNKQVMSELGGIQLESVNKALNYVNDSEDPAQENILSKSVDIPIQRQLAEDENLSEEELQNCLDDFHNPLRERLQNRFDDIQIPLKQDVQEQLDEAEIIPEEGLSEKDFDNSQISTEAEFQNHLEDKSFSENDFNNKLNSSSISEGDILKNKNIVQTSESVDQTDQKDSSLLSTKQVINKSNDIHLESVEWAQNKIDESDFSSKEHLKINLQTESFDTEVQMKSAGDENPGEIFRNVSDDSQIPIKQELQYQVDEAEITSDEELSRNQYEDSQTVSDEELQNQLEDEGLSQVDLENKLNVSFVIHQEDLQSQQDDIEVQSKEEFDNKLNESQKEILNKEVLHGESLQRQLKKDVNEELQNIGHIPDNLSTKKLQNEFDSDNVEIEFKDQELNQNIDSCSKEKVLNHLDVGQFLHNDLVLNELDNIMCPTREFCLTKEDVPQFLHNDKAIIPLDPKEQSKDKFDNKLHESQFEKLQRKIVNEEGLQSKLTYSEKELQYNTTMPDNITLYNQFDYSRTSQEHELQNQLVDTKIPSDEISLNQLDDHETTSSAELHNQLNDGENLLREELQNQFDKIDQDKILIFSNKQDISLSDNVQLESDEQTLNKTTDACLKQRVLNHLDVGQFLHNDLVQNELDTVKCPTPKPCLTQEDVSQFLHNEKARIPLNLDNSKSIQFSLNDTQCAESKLHQPLSLKRISEEHIPKDLKNVQYSVKQNTYGHDNDFSSEHIDVKSNFNKENLDKSHDCKFKVNERIIQQYQTGSSVYNSEIENAKCLRGYEIDGADQPEFREKLLLELNYLPSFTNDVDDDDSQMCDEQTHCNISEPSGFEADSKIHVQSHKANLNKSYDLEYKMNEQIIQRFQKGVSLYNSEEENGKYFDQSKVKQHSTKQSASLNHDLKVTDSENFTKKHTIETINDFHDTSDYKIYEPDQLEFREKLLLESNYRPSFTNDVNAFHCEADCKAHSPSLYNEPSLNISYDLEYKVNEQIVQQFQKGNSVYNSELENGKDFVYLRPKQHMKVQSSDAQSVLLNEELKKTDSDDSTYIPSMETMHDSKYLSGYVIHEADQQKDREKLLLELNYLPSFTNDQIPDEQSHCDISTTSGFEDDFEVHVQSQRSQENPNKLYAMKEKENDQIIQQVEKGLPICNREVENNEDDIQLQLEEQTVFKSVEELQNHLSNLTQEKVRSQLEDSQSSLIEEFKPICELQNRLEGAVIQQEGDSHIQLHCQSPTLEDLKKKSEVSENQKVLNHLDVGQFLHTDLVQNELDNVKCPSCDPCLAQDDVAQLLHNEMATIPLDLNTCLPKQDIKNQLDIHSHNYPYRATEVKQNQLYDAKNQHVQNLKIPSNARSDVDGELQNNPNDTKSSIQEKWQDQLNNVHNQCNEELMKCRDVPESDGVQLEPNEQVFNILESSVSESKEKVLNHLDIGQFLHNDLIQNELDCVKCPSCEPCLAQVDVAQLLHNEKAVIPLDLDNSQNLLKVENNIFGDDLRNKSEGSSNVEELKQQPYFSNNPFEEELENNLIDAKLQQLHDAQLPSKDDAQIQCKKHIQNSLRNESNGSDSPFEEEHYLQYYSDDELRNQSEESSNVEELKQQLNTVFNPFEEALENNLIDVQLQHLNDTQLSSKDDAQIPYKQQLQNKLRNEFHGSDSPFEEEHYSHHNSDGTRISFEDDLQSKFLEYQIKPNDLSQYQLEQVNLDEELNDRLGKSKSPFEHDLPSTLGYVETSLKEELLDQLHDVEIAEEKKLQKHSDSFEIESIEKLQNQSGKLTSKKDLQKQLGGSQDEFLKQCEIELNGVELPGDIIANKQESDNNTQIIPKQELLDHLQEAQHHLEMELLNQMDTAECQPKEQIPIQLDETQISFQDGLKHQVYDPKTHYSQIQNEEKIQHQFYEAEKAFKNQPECAPISEDGLQSQLDAVEIFSKDGFPIDLGDTKISVTEEIEKYEVVDKKASRELEFQNVLDHSQPPPEDKLLSRIQACDDDLQKVESISQDDLHDKLKSAQVTSKESIHDQPENDFDSCSGLHILNNDTVSDGKEPENHYNDAPTIVEVLQVQVSNVEFSPEKDIQEAQSKFEKEIQNHVIDDISPSVDQLDKKTDNSEGGFSIDLGDTQISVNEKLEKDEFDVEQASRELEFQSVWDDTKPPPKDKLQSRNQTCDDDLQNVENISQDDLHDKLKNAQVTSKQNIHDELDKDLDSCISFQILNNGSVSDGKEQEKHYNDAPTMGVEVLQVELSNVEFLPEKDIQESHSKFEKDLQNHEVDDISPPIDQLDKKTDYLKILSNDSQINEDHYNNYNQVNINQVLTEEEMQEDLCNDKIIIEQELQSQSNDDSSSQNDAELQKELYDRIPSDYSEIQPDEKMHSQQKDAKITSEEILQNVLDETKVELENLLQDKDRISRTPELQNQALDKQILFDEKLHDHFFDAEIASVKVSQSQLNNDDKPSIVESQNDLYDAENCLKEERQKRLNDTQISSEEFLFYDYSSSFVYELQKQLPYPHLPSVDVLQNYLNDAESLHTNRLQGQCEEAENLPVEALQHQHFKDNISNIYELQKQLPYPHMPSVEFLPNYFTDSESLSEQRGQRQCEDAETPSIDELQNQLNEDSSPYVHELQKQLPYPHMPSVELLPNYLRDAERLSKQRMEIKSEDAEISSGEDLKNKFEKDDSSYVYECQKQLPYPHMPSVEFLPNYFIDSESLLKQRLQRQCEDTEPPSVNELQNHLNEDISSNLYELQNQLPHRPMPPVAALQNYSNDAESSNKVGSQLQFNDIQSPTEQALENKLQESSFLAKDDRSQRQFDESQISFKESGRSQLDDDEIHSKGDLDTNIEDIFDTQINSDGHIKSELNSCKNPSEEELQNQFDDEEIPFQQELHNELCEAQTPTNEQMLQNEVNAVDDKKIRNPLLDVQNRSEDVLQCQKDDDESQFEEELQNQLKDDLIPSEEEFEIPLRKTYISAEVCMLHNQFGDVQFLFKETAKCQSEEEERQLKNDLQNYDNDDYISHQGDLQCKINDDGSQFKDDLHSKLNDFHIKHEEDLENGLDEAETSPEVNVLQNQINVDQISINDRLQSKRDEDETQSEVEIKNDVDCTNMLDKDTLHTDKSPLQRSEILDDANLQLQSENDSSQSFSLQSINFCQPGTMKYFNKDDAKSFPSDHELIKQVSNEHMQNDLDVVREIPSEHMLKDLDDVLSLFNDKIHEKLDDNSSIHNENEDLHNESEEFSSVTETEPKQHILTVKLSNTNIAQRDISLGEDAVSDQALNLPHSSGTRKGDYQIYDENNNIEDDDNFLCEDDGDYRVVDDNGLVDVFKLEQQACQAEKVINKTISKLRKKTKKIMSLKKHIEQLNKETTEVTQLYTQAQFVNKALATEAKDVKSAMAAVCDLIVSDVEAESKVQRLEAQCYRRYTNIASQTDANNVLASIRSRQKALSDLELMVHRKQLMLSHSLPSTVDITKLNIKKPRPPAKANKRKIIDDDSKSESTGGRSVTLEIVSAATATSSTDTDTSQQQWKTENTTVKPPVPASIGSILDSQTGELTALYGPWPMLVPTTTGPQENTIAAEIVSLIEELPDSTDSTPTLSFTPSNNDDPVIQ